MKTPLFGEKQTEYQYVDLVRPQNKNMIIEEGNIAAWTAIWSATVAEDNPEDGMPVKAGSRIQMRLAVITEVVDGLIVRQHEYVSNPEVV